MKLGHFFSASAVRDPRKTALGLENESTSGVLPGAARNLCLRCGRLFEAPLRVKECEGAGIAFSCAHAARANGPYVSCLVVVAFESRRFPEL